MKRKADCLIEKLVADTESGHRRDPEEDQRQEPGHCHAHRQDPEEDQRQEPCKSARMDVDNQPGDAWKNALATAEKSVILENKIRKVHFLFRDGRQMLEEYNEDTGCLCRRMWKTSKGLNIAKEEITDDWSVEVGENPARRATKDLEPDFRESKDQPTLTRRNTRINLEWRIRNLPYPIETYSVAADSQKKCLVVRTTNKKYFKTLPIPELERLGLDVVQKNVEFAHKFNTLIITYKKPKELTDFEKAQYDELKKIEPIKNDINDCKPS